MNETTFEDARVGDKLWDSKFGWGEVLNTYAGQYYPLYVRFNLNGDRKTYNYQGEENKNQLRTLFWDEIKFEIPPRPKRKVRKVVEGWVNLVQHKTENPCREPFSATCGYKASSDAANHRGVDITYIGEPFFIHHEYEVEE